MIGRLQDAWDRLIADVWIPMGDYSTEHFTAPPDLFSDLYSAASDFLAVRPGRDLEDARSDPERAQDLFLALAGSDFFNEGAVIDFLQEADQVVGAYELPSFQNHYRLLITQTLTKYNLRYRVEEPFVLRFLLPGSFANLYAEMYRLARSDPHVGELMQDFEIAFDRYARTQDPYDLRVCIGKVSNFAEGIASAAAGYPSRNNTLGAIAGQLAVWPHDKVRDSVVNLYHFCSDFPGVRHGGSPRGRRRGVDIRDSVAVSVAMISLAAYLSSGMDHGEVLGFGPGGSFRPRLIAEPTQAAKVPLVRRLLGLIGMSR